MLPNHNIPVGARTALLGPAPLPSTPRMYTTPLPPTLPVPGPAYPSPPTTPRTAPQPSMARQAPPSAYAYHAHGYPSPVSPQRPPLPGPALQLHAEAQYAPFIVHEAIRYTGAGPALCNWDVKYSPATLRVGMNAPVSNPPMLGAVTIQLYLVPGLPAKVVQVDKPAGQPVTVGEVLHAISNALRQPINTAFSNSIGAMKLARIAPRAQGGAVCYLHVLEHATRFMGVRASATANRTLEVHFAP